MDLILFDVDGTLIDSLNIILTSQRRTAEAHGLIHPGHEAGCAIVGLSLERALGELFGPHVDAAALADTYKGVFQSLRGAPGFDEPMFDGAAEVLAALGGWDRACLGVATGKTRRGLDHIIARHAWHGLFKTMQTADDAPSKPDPTMIHQAASQAGARVERTVMIGDSVHDMRMAKAAGCMAIGVSWGFQPAHDLIAAGADCIADEVGNLPAMIAAALGRQPSTGRLP
jgi:phosphoglycolate phosphatase